MATLTRNAWGQLLPTTFSLLLREELVTFLDVKNRDDAIDALIDLMDQQGVFSDRCKFREAIFKREELVSTGIGMGIAIPHAKLREFFQFSVAIGIQRERGIDWNALDSVPVRMIFMIAGPEDRQVEYLQILSQLTSSIREERVRKGLIRAETADEILGLFRHPDLT